MARILVIDDDQGIRDLLAAWLTADGHECVAADNGHDGIASVRAAPVDIVITDLVMKYNGEMTIRVVRWEFPKTGIIAMTGHTRERLEEAKTAGADRLLSKPFDQAALRAAIGELLAGWRRPE